MTKEKRQRHTIIIILFLVIIILLILLIISRIIGKIGYENTSTEPSDIIYVTENDIGWDLLEQLNIFRESEYLKTPIIKPGDHGKYTFLVTNVTDKDLIYDLQLREINEYKINMRYKLKLDNIYVSGNKENWKSIDDVGLESIIVPPKSNNRYTLEWCWIHNYEQDTKIGKLDYACYTLRLKIGAQTYDKRTGVNP